MARVWVCLLFLWFFWAATGWAGEHRRPQILPLELDTTYLTKLGVQPGDDVWLEVVFRASPDGVVLHTEVAEKVWWIQDTGYLFLGSTGASLPRDLMKRATAYVDLFSNQTALSVRPILVKPKTQAVLLGDTIQEISAALRDELPAVDASYLSQVANYMANHVTTLEVTGSSYWVDGVGMVIDQTGRWLGTSSFHFGADLVPVPAGSFVHGSISDACRALDEAPFLHILERELEVMDTEVTRSMWVHLRMAQPSLPRDPSVNVLGDNSLTNAVGNVTWYEALLFANLLSDACGLTPCYYLDAAFTTVLDASNYTDDDQNVANDPAYHCDFSANGYRLPTEGEWEYFARAATSTPFWAEVPTYDASTCETCGWSYYPLNIISVFSCNSGDFPRSARIQEKNPWGLYGIHGGTGEWCWDWYDDYPTSSAGNYTGPSTGTTRVWRGGTRDSSAKDIRSASRYANDPWSRQYDVGFRLVRTMN